MDIYEVKWTQLQASIFRLLCIRTGERLSLRKIARLLKKTPTAISNALDGLKKENSITVEKSKEMNLLSIQLNRDNSCAIELKRVENLRMIYESKIVDFLRNSLPGGTIILFGSYSRGEDTVKSDIDIAVIGRKEKELSLDEFDEIFERKVIINFYQSFRGIHKHLLDNILNGIVLNGGVEL
ncbi:MAG: nucleotidyltransferase domain-containing protein [Nanoarchaeota archaeon]|nr:nucleotidyltransferase domain-containing protein [Nanoarchaeota archaeon]